MLAGPVWIMSLLLLFHRLLTDLWMDIWLILTKYVQSFYQITACPRNVLRFLKTTKWNLSWKCTKSQEKAKRPENNYCLILSPTWLHYWEVCSWFRELQRTTQVGDDEVDYCVLHIHNHSSSEIFTLLSFLFSI